MSFISSLLKAKVRYRLHLFWALRLVWQSSPSWTLVRIVILTVQGVIPLLTLYFTKLVVDTLAANASASDKGVIFYQVAIYLGWAGIVILVEALCNSLAELINTAQSQRITDYIQDILHAKSIEVDLECYENPQYQDIRKRAEQEAPYRPSKMLVRLVNFGKNSISLLAITGLLLSLNWWITGILFLSTIPPLLVRLKFAKVMYHWERQQTKLDRHSWYFSWILTRAGSAQEVRLFDLGTLFSQWFRRLREQMYNERLTIAIQRFVSSLGVQASSEILIFAVYVFIVYQSIQGILSLGDVVLFFQAFQRGKNSFQALMTSLAGLYEDNLFLSHFYEFLELKPKVTEPLNPLSVPFPIQIGIVFNHVSFKYAGTTRQALNDISLTIKPRETIALVGENGSGKTTLIKLLCRLYDPTEGSITIDGVDIRQFKINSLRWTFSIVFQDYGKYQLTAKENIRLGNIHIAPESEKIMAAARLSGADEFIIDLPQAYNTFLGNFFEHGEELSIGQWQRVALARAFVRDAQVIILDEPTSALDAKAEAQVLEKFHQLIQNQSAILISHRLSTVRMADRIYVLEKGRIVESGTHDQLIQLGGKYAHLFETQAKNYR